MTQTEPQTQTQLAWLRVLPGDREVEYHAVGRRHKITTPIEMFLGGPVPIAYGNEAERQETLGYHARILDQRNSHFDIPEANAYVDGVTRRDGETITEAVIFCRIPEEKYQEILENPSRDLRTQTD